MERANGRRNLHVLERAIELYLSGSAGTRSPHEDAFLALAARRVPEPLVNTQLAGFEVDFLWPEAMLVVEIDGGGHGRPPARRKDALEDRVLRGAGYTVLRFTDARSPRSGPPADVIDRRRGGGGRREGPQWTLVSPTRRQNGFGSGSRGRHAAS